MGYDHSMTAAIRFKPGITIDQVVSALAPIAEYCDWTKDNIETNDLGGDDTIELAMEGGFVQRMLLYTAGEVSYEYPDLVESMASNFTAIAVPGYFELKDHDTGDLENAITKVWFGDDEGKAAAQRAQAWDEAKALLHKAGVDSHLLVAMASVGGFHDTP